MGRVRRKREKSLREKGRIVSGRKIYIETGG